MPQASDELRQRMDDMFGDPISEFGPIKFLKGAGYTLNRDWSWSPREGVDTIEDMSNEEFQCLQFLVHEWDFDGLKERSKPATLTPRGSDE